MTPTLKASYGVCELAAMAGESRYVLLRMLDGAGVPLHRRGRNLFVYLSDLKRLMPGLWDSVLDLVQYGRVAPDHDDEYEAS